MTLDQQRVPLAQQLLGAGLVTTVQLDLAEREQERIGTTLGHILVQLGFVDPDVLAEEKRITRARRAVEKAIVLLRTS